MHEYSTAAQKKCAPPDNPVACRTHTTPGSTPVIEKEADPTKIYETLHGRRYSARNLQ